MHSTAQQENIKIHSVRHVLQKLRRNVPNEEFRRKIISSSLIITTARFEPLPELKPETNHAYELLLYNKRIDSIIAQLDEGIQNTTSKYEEARLALSATLAASGLEEAMQTMPHHTDTSGSFYPPILSYFKNVLSNSYQYSIRLVQLGKRIEGITRSSEDLQREQKWYLHPNQLNRLSLDRRDLYDKLTYEHRTLTDILAALEP